MNSRQTTNFDPITPLLNLLERRFALRLPTDSSIAHLQMVREHYMVKREMLLWEHGEAEALKKEEYAKAVLISETVRQMMLREIDPRPKKNKKGIRKNGY